MAHSNIEVSEHTVEFYIKYKTHRLFRLFSFAILFLGRNQHILSIYNALTSEQCLRRNN